MPHPSKSQSLPPADAPLSSPGQPKSSHSDKIEETANSTVGEVSLELPTLVSIDLAYEFANPLYAMAASGTIEKISGKIMDAFEKRAREVYGDGLN